MVVHKVKKFLLAIIFISPFLAFGQSAQRFTAQLTAACSNSTSSCNGTAGSQLVQGIGEYTLGTVTVTGTFTGATISFEFSDDAGITWYQNTCTRSDIFVQEGSEALTNSTNRSWDCGLAAISFFRIRLTAISTGTVNVALTVSAAQIEPAQTVALNSTDPCQSSSIVKQHVFKNITTATTTAIVAPSGTLNVYICGIDFQLNSTTASTVLFEFGTGTACATSPTAVSATYSNGALVSETVHMGFGGHSYFAPLGAGQGFCAVSTVGAGPTIAVDVTFIQQ
jgi:hypothetical protein